MIAALILLIITLAVPIRATNNEILDGSIILWEMRSIYGFSVTELKAPLLNGTQLIEYHIFMHDEIDDDHYKNYIEAFKYSSSITIPDCNPINYMSSYLNFYLNGMREREKKQINYQHAMYTQEYDGIIGAKQNLLSIFNDQKIIINGQCRHFCNFLSTYFTYLSKVKKYEVLSFVIKTNHLEDTIIKKLTYKYKIINDDAWYRYFVGKPGSGDDFNNHPIYTNENDSIYDNTEIVSYNNHEMFDNDFISLYRIKKN